MFYYKNCDFFKFTSKGFLYKNYAIAFHNRIIMLFISFEIACVSSSNEAGYQKLTMVIFSEIYGIMRA